MNEDWNDLNLVELMDLLEPVPEPVPVVMVPQTAGWLWLGAGVCIVLTIAGRYALTRWRQNAYRRRALRELQDCPDDAGQLALLVRRTVLAVFPRHEVASLHGRDWLAFLDRSYGGDAFSSGAGQQLAAAPYRDVRPDESLKRLVETWIRKHRGPGA